MRENECKHGRLARKCDTCYLEREIQRLADLNTDLEQEIERLKKVEARYEEYLQQPDCFDCGHTLTEVRPGKHQCDWCELGRENQQLKAAILKTLEENGHLADGDNCTLIALKQAIGVV